MQNDSQKAFEKWCNDNMLPHQRYDLKDIGYRSYTTHSMWQGWQASRAELLARLESDEVVERVAREMYSKEPEPDGVARYYKGKIISQPLEFDRLLEITKHKWIGRAKAALTAIKEGL